MAQYKNQEVGYDFLTNRGFKVLFNKLPTVEFYCQGFQIPGVNMGTANFATPSNVIPYPGEKIQYDVLTISFIVDAKMNNYVELYKWIKQNSYEDTGVEPPTIADSTVTLMVLDANFAAVRTFIFEGVVPVGITSLNFDSTDSEIDYITATVDFAYTRYIIGEVGY